MRRLFGRLRKSQSAHEDNERRRRKSDVAPESTAGTSNGNVLTSPPRYPPQSLHSSRTFDATGRPYYSISSTAYTNDYRGVGGGGATSVSSCCGEESRFDPELDRSMMQTITDVKYVNRRPKFTAVVDANFQRQCLEAHNLVRQIYGSPALIWSQELADLAKTWALKLAERGRILYPELAGIGENIQLVTDETGDHLTTGSELVALWASEAEHFDFANPKWSIKCKNFTQMIWRSSIELGVARYWNTPKNCLAIVAFYRPGGNSNAPGEFAINLPSKSELSGDVRKATSLEALIAMMNRAALNDGGFLPPKRNMVLKDSRPI